MVLFFLTGGRDGQREGKRINKLMGETETTYPSDAVPSAATAARCAAAAMFARRPGDLVRSIFREDWGKDVDVEVEELRSRFGDLEEANEPRAAEAAAAA